MCRGERDGMENGGVRRREATRTPHLCSRFSCFSSQTFPPTTMSTNPSTGQSHMGSGDKQGESLHDEMTAPQAQLMVERKGAPAAKSTGAEEEARTVRYSGAGEEARAGKDEKPGQGEGEVAPGEEGTKGRRRGGRVLRLSARTKEALTRSRQRVVINFALCLLSSHVRAPFPSLIERTPRARRAPSFDALCVCMGCATAEEREPVEKTTMPPSIHFSLLLCPLLSSRTRGRRGFLPARFPLTRAHARSVCMGLYSGGEEREC